MSIRSLATDPPAKPPTDFSALTRFIPTETVTFYVAGLNTANFVSKLPQDGQQNGPAFFTPQFVFFLCLGLTPLVVYIVSVFQTPVDPKVPRTSLIPSMFVIWRMIAGTMAYTVWALAVPDNKIFDSPGWSAVWGFVTLLSSFFLSAFEAIVNYLIERAKGNAP